MQAAKAGGRQSREKLRVWSWVTVMGWSCHLPPTKTNLSFGKGGILGPRNPAEIPSGAGPICKKQRGWRGGGAFVVVHHTGLFSAL